ncbi:MAG: hypothetical protein EAZ44_03655 [Cytophagia bacterium]|nr:MAG: hypothetical protein EAY69_00260 [Cytophagales bacterium]TAG05240.1 MAG: hypothetical protein EAZ44_03655 [Cytophagia bacterium]TAG43867.1 MAG: hypothetical protein EAZ31_03395 [Cytophagia bacterium]TAH30144.1 MAG: hypothetical protein EAZ06_04220 [Cytophagales bacterium]
MNSKNNFIDIITPLVADLYVMSETDAALTPFVWEDFSVEKKIEKDTILEYLQKEKDTTFESISLERFFKPFLKIRKDDDEDTIATAQQFKTLEEKLIEILKEIEVLRIGTVEIDVYIVGKNEQNQYVGLQTFVVET